jgi:predicted alpha/beta-hydrolase family hydrolase
MDSRSMQSITEALTTVPLRIARFEIAYMAARRSGARKPPPRADKLLSEYVEAVEALRRFQPLIIGGKSMGGRVASMIADELYERGLVKGLLCIGYPFHPPGKPQDTRTGHLAALRTPTLIVQGTRDPFGTPDDVAGYNLPPALDILWLEDGDHDLRPRKKLTGLSAADHLTATATGVREWLARLQLA